MIEYVNGISAIVRNAGTAISRSCHGTFLLCIIISAPTSTSAGAAAAAGTTAASGVNSSVSPNSAPVNTLASPVRAPSPTPAADSTKTVPADALTAPPITPPTPSTVRIRPSRGTRPRSSTSPASSLTPMIVPIASKNPDSTRVNSTTVAVSAPARAKPPNRSNWPTSPKSGADTSASGTRGVTTPHAPGSMVASAFTTMARTAVTTMLIRMAAGVPRTNSAIISSSPKQNTATGQPDSRPVAPSCTGVPARRASRTRRPPGR